MSRAIFRGEADFLVFSTFRRGVELSSNAMDSWPHTNAIPLMVVVILWDDAFTKMDCTIGFVGLKISFAELM